MRTVQKVFVQAIAVATAFGACDAPPAEHADPVETVQAAICEGQPSGSRPDFTSCVRTPWPQGRIPYAFVNGSNAGETWTAAERSEVRTAMDDWEARTGGVIRFVEDASDAERVQLFWAGGCRSDLGWISAAGPQGASVRACGAWGIRHELGHTIGLSHHHQRMDRNRYVFLRQSILCASDALYSDNLVRCTNGDGSDYGPYELASVMHYGSEHPSGCTASTCSMVTKEGNMIFKGSTVTAGDGSAVLEMYHEPKGWQRYRPIVSADPGSTSRLDTRPATSADLSGAPALSRFGTGGGVVSVVRGTNNLIYVKFNSTGGVNWPSGYWQNIGGDFSSDPAATSWGDGRLDVVAVGTDGNLWHKWHLNGTWAANWGNLGRPNGNAISAPAIASWGPDRLDIFVRSVDRLYQKTWNGAWTAWQELPNSCCISGKPAAVSWGNGRIDVVAVSTVGILHHRAFASGSWFPWGSLGVVPRSGTSPAIASKAANTLDVFISNADGRVAHQWWNGSSWSGFFEIGGLPANSPAAAGTPTGAAHLVIRQFNGTHAGVWHRRWQ